MDDLSLARRAAAEAAAAILDRHGNFGTADYKGDVDPVTAADREAEAIITGLLRTAHPDDGILAEEEARIESRSGRRWVIDPLDGTVNFLHGVPQVAVSLALEDESGALLGVTRDVFRGEEFVAVRGNGAELDGEPITVSTCTALSRALVSTGFPYDRNREADRYAGHIARVLPHVQGIRRAGSACLDLAWVACGRYDGHWELNLAPWDVSAGFLLVAEAGGAVHGFGEPPSHRGFAAGSELVAGGLVELIGSS